MAKPFSAALLMTVASQALADVCLKDTTGTCRFLGCYSSRGPADCVSGHCICKPGYCAYEGKCASPARCDITTPGTCRLFGCKDKRGAVDCVDGKCICKPGACAFDGVCVEGCQADTGGSCKVLGCSSSRNAECSGGDCVCKAGTCALDGKCVAGSEVALLMAGNYSAMSTKPQIDSLDDILDRIPDVDPVLGLAVVCGFAAAAGLGLVALRRRGGRSDGAETLLADESAVAFAKLAS